MTIGAAAALSALMILAAPVEARARDETPEAAMSRAYEHLEAGRLDEAEAAFRGLSGVDPVGRRARMERAYLELRRRRWPEAVALLGSLLDEDRSDARLRMELGYARLALGDRPAAADEFALAAREPGEYQERALAEVAALAVEEGAEASEARLDALLNEGYEDLRRRKSSSAREKFQTALLVDPGQTEVSKQLGYMSLEDGDPKEAATRFAGVRLLEPRDYVTHLELGYIYDSLHDEAAAEKAFAKALPSPDPAVRALAQRALDAIRAPSDPLYLDIDAAAYDASRFKNRIYSLDAQAGWKPNPEGPVSVYLGARWSQDTRSKAAAEIYSDDAVSVAPGIRIQPRGSPLSLSAEWGVTVNLLRTPEHPSKTETNGRVVLGGYRYRPIYRRFFADASLQAGYYSRFNDNFIGSLRLRAGVKAWDNQQSQLTFYAPVEGIKDSKRDFYNNLVEAGGGVELQPWMRLNLRIRAEALRGFYSGVEGRDPNPYPRKYDEVRIFLVYSAHFTRRPAPDDFEPTRRKRLLW